jgi:hypothetical protein
LSHQQADQQSRRQEHRTEREMRTKLEQGKKFTYRSWKPNWGDTYGGLRELTFNTL